MISEAIILAGGLGTRLRSAVPDLPKCMADVANKPFLSYIIAYYREQGVRRFIFSIGYMHEVIEQYLLESHPHLDYTCSVEPEPLGTGGAILKACSLVQAQNILVVNGDTLFEVSVEQMSTFHERHHSHCTLALKKILDSDRYGVVETDELRRIVSFKEKQWHAESIINGGVYALNVSSFQQEHFPEKFSFEKDYLEKFYLKRNMFGVLQEGYFIDIGIPSDYARAQIDFSEKNISGHA